MNELLKSTRLGGPPPQSPRLPDGSPACGSMFGPGRFTAGGTTLALLAQNLSDLAGRIVVDRTGLAGVFDIVLDYSQDTGASFGPASAAGSDNPGIFTALEEQLGLKLQPGRGPVQVLVIDRIERPTEN
jgi:uncharacterized protein (TIGR03435 family)